jgi:hypothetical protein
MQILPAGRVPDGGRGRATLMLCHFVGMVDLVALPVWVGTLAQHYGFDLEHAGMIVTAFLLGAVGASLAAAPLFNRLPRSACAAAATASPRWPSSAPRRRPRFGAWPRCTWSPASPPAPPCRSRTAPSAAARIRTSCSPSSARRSASARWLFYAAVPPAIAAHGGATLFKCSPA